MASSTIAEISRPGLQDLSTPPVASITDVKHLSSYNWIERPTPTISVPGSPSLWTPPTVSRRLNKDSGLSYIDQNAARHPDSPLEPLFRALYITDPTFDVRPVDVITDRNNIRKLLSFINPDSPTRRYDTFVIGIEVTKKTAIFRREQNVTRQYIAPHEFQGFGHEFEKAYTTDKISGSTGHHRIISYHFGDLHFIVRHETDGYIDSSTKLPVHQSKQSGGDRVAGMLESLSLSSTIRSPNVPTKSKLTIKEEGQLVPIESTIEIKTRAAHKSIQVRDVAPQLWISQTPKLVRAYHNGGIFRRPEVEDVAAEIKRWEESNQEDLRKLAGLINKIISVVKTCGNATVRYDGGDKLVVQKADKEKMLPSDLYSKWEDRESST